MKATFLAPPRQTMWASFGRAAPEEQRGAGDCDHRADNRRFRGNAPAQDAATGAADSYTGRRALDLTGVSSREVEIARHTESIGIDLHEHGRSRAARSGRQFAALRSPVRPCAVATAKPASPPEGNFTSVPPSSSANSPAQTPPRSADPSPAARDRTPSAHRIRAPRANPTP